MHQAVQVALLDLDGTLYRGDTVIEGAPEFVQRLRRRGIRPVYFTNNSTRTPMQVAQHLGAFGFDCTPDDVCTSAQAAAYQVAERYGAGGRVAYLGMEGIRVALAESGMEPISVQRLSASNIVADAAVLGLCTDVTFAGLTAFCRVAEAVGGFYLTNADMRLPVTDGIWPGNGAFGQLISAVTGLTPIVAGKPEPSFVDYALKRYGYQRSEAVIIGDNLLTDILAGILANVYTIHVQTGIANPRPGSPAIAAHSTTPTTAAAPALDEIVPGARADSVAALFL